jgi:hypothetical protein
MNVLSFEKRARPPAPEWRPEGSSATYFELLIDGLPLSEHLIPVGRSNGFEPEPTDRGPELLFPSYVDGGSVENVGFYNYLCPAGWTNEDWQRDWLKWLQRDAPVPTSPGRVPLLVGGWCAGCVATVAEVGCNTSAITWSRFQERTTGDGERLVLPELYAGLEFRFEKDQYLKALGPLVEAVE